MRNRTLTVILPFLLFTLFPFNNLLSQPEKPKLILGIVVDQMTNDYLSRYYDRFSEGGFKRLINSGFYFRNSNYEYAPTLTAPGHTCIYTGSLPCYDGIITNEWFDRNSGKKVYCADDSTVTAVGIQTDKEKFSPNNMTASTVTDELIKAEKNSKVISISLKDRGAIFAGGHSGKSFWFETYSGNFITTTYYMNELPEWMKKFNGRNLKDFYINQAWTTLYPIESYTESSADDVPWESLFKGTAKPVFPYVLSSLIEKNPELFEYTPYGNSILKELALTVLQNEKLGEGDATDFFGISFSSPDKVGHHFGPNSIEIEDTYLRLDKDLAEIFDYLDKNIGFENALIFLTSDHGIAPAPGYLNSIGIPAQSLEIKTLRESVEKFLDEKYGEESWISWIGNLQIYFNESALQRKNILLTAIENDVCNYIKNYPGIKEVYSADGIENKIYNSEKAGFLSNGFIKEKSGDVFIVLDSNWIWNMKRGTTHGTGYKYDRNVPLLWCGWKIKHGETDKYNSQCDIAPTVSEILNIPKPSKNAGNSLTKIILK